MMQLALVLTAAGALLRLDFRSASVTWSELEGRLVLAEGMCAEPTEPAFALLTDPPCQGIHSAPGNRLYLLLASASKVLRYEDIVSSAINASEFQWEVTIPSNLDLEKTVLGLNIERGDIKFPNFTSYPCPLSCRIAPRRLDYGTSSSSEGDDCEKDDSSSSCERVSLPTWVSIILTLALCIG